MSDNYARMEMPIGEIGRALACADDHAQAGLINTFGKELHVVCRGDESMQICAISSKIDKHGERLLRDLIEFLDLRKEGE